MRNVLVVVDTRDLRHCVNMISREGQLDYSKYIEACFDEKTERIYNKLAYGTCANLANLKPFVGMLKILGFNVKMKKALEIKGPDIPEDDPKLRWVSNHIDMALDVVDIVNNSGKIDKVVIGGSQPELVPLVEWLKHRGIEVVVFSANIWRVLKNSANSVQDLADHKYSYLITEKQPKEE